MIKPTVGRIVGFHETGHIESSRPLAAIVTFVHSDTSVNLHVFGAFGGSEGRSGVTLYQGEGERPPHAHAEWMPYQIEQARKEAAGS